MPEVPRAEYPRPQFVRPDWRCLNGEWEFEFDSGDSGLERGLLTRPLSGRIIVPFCPESTLSGVEDRDFHRAVWYRRVVEIPEQWGDRRTVLRFQAVDHDATVWVDGKEVVRHRGGFTPFSADLGRRSGPVEVVVRARDEGPGPQARGKQSRAYHPYGCFYPRTTGIWQTVWCEPLPARRLRRPRVTPDVAGSAFHLVVPVSANRPGDKLRVTLHTDGDVLATAEVPTHLDLAAQVTVVVPGESLRLWAPGDPHLYDLRLELVDGDDRVVDRADTYAGLRSVAIDGRRVLINGQTVFQRLVLDQGYYPDGIMTAASDADLARDIELSMAAGFNGARLHQKVFEERFLYHADRAGYLVWGEFPDWGAHVGGPIGDEQQPSASFVGQWLEAIGRDYSHPSIVGWCPLNETRQSITDRITTLDDVARAMFLAAKALDPTRPVLDASGYSHRVPETDIYDSHSYEQDPLAFAEQMAGLADGSAFTCQDPNGAAWSIPYSGQPYFCSEFGGIWWSPEGDSDGESWGYGSRPRTEQEFLDRFEGLVKVLLDDPDMFGYCYTQLTDTYQERNGIYRFDRSPKLPVERVRAVQQQIAAIEAARPQ